MSRENFWWPSAFFSLVRLSRTFLCLLLLMMLAESAWEQRLKTCTFRLKLPMLVWINICGTLVWFRMWTSRNMFFSLVERTVLNTSGLYAVLLLPGRTAPSARYLGAQVHYSGKLHTEIDKRLQIAKRNWAKMGPLWSFLVSFLLLQTWQDFGVCCSRAFCSFVWTRISGFGCR